jgi:hypothetical protein
VKIHINLYIYMHEYIYTLIQTYLHTYIHTYIFDSPLKLLLFSCICISGYLIVTFVMARVDIHRMYVQRVSRQISEQDYSSTPWDEVNPLFRMSACLSDGFTFFVFLFKSRLASQRGAEVCIISFSYLSVNEFSHSKENNCENTGPSKSCNTDRDKNPMSLKIHICINHLI